MKTSWTDLLRDFSKNARALLKPAVAEGGEVQPNGPRLSTDGLDSDKREVLLAQALLPAVEHLKEELDPRPVWLSVIQYNPDLPPHLRHSHLNFGITWEAVFEQFPLVRDRMLLLTGIASGQYGHTLPPSSTALFTDPFVLEYGEPEGFPDRARWHFGLKLAPDGGGHCWCPGNGCFPEQDDKHPRFQLTNTVPDAFAGFLDNLRLPTAPLAKRVATTFFLYTQHYTDPPASIAPDSYWVTLFLPWHTYPGFPYAISGLLIAFDKRGWVQNLDQCELWTAGICSELAGALWASRVLRREGTPHLWRRQIARERIAHSVKAMRAEASELNETDVKDHNATSNAGPEWRPYIRLLESPTARTSPRATRFAAKLEEDLSPFSPLFAYEQDPSAAAHGSQALTTLRHGLLQAAAVEAELRPTEIAERRLPSSADQEVSFSQLVGGVRPVVIMLAPDNEYVAWEAAREHTPGVALAGPEGAWQKREFWEVPGEPDYLKVLNNLSVAFDLKCPVVNTQSGLAAFGLEVELLRDRVGAVVVQKEWQEQKGQTRRGFDIVRFLSTRFPEFTYFLMADRWTADEVRKALGCGAIACFETSEHGYSSFAGEASRLTFLQLAELFQDAARLSGERFPETPDPGQIDIDPIDPESRRASQDLVKRLGLSVPLERTSRGRAFERLLAGLFPEGDRITPGKLLTTGRSTAKATFFARIHRNEERRATRFVKVGPWLEIEREYRGYRRAIRPRLSSHVAHIVVRPVMSGSEPREMRWGALVYSLAGLPEAYHDLRSLHETLEAALGADEDNFSGFEKRLEKTLNSVLDHLWMPGGRVPKPAKRPLWRWLGDVLPPAFTGDLETIADATEALNRPAALHVKGRRTGKFQEPTAWILAGRDIQKIDAIRKGRTRERRRILAEDFELSEVQLRKPWVDGGEVTIRHPDLGLRIRLWGQGTDIWHRFDGAWVRNGHPVNLGICLHRSNRKYDELRAKRKDCTSPADQRHLHRVLGTLMPEEPRKTRRQRAAANSASNATWPSDPVSFFEHRVLPPHLTIEAISGPIHGDLNLHNIQFTASGQEPGWLIDFGSSAEDGMVAFDLAKLEVELWHHFVYPRLASLARLTHGWAPRRRSAFSHCLDLLQAALQAADSEGHAEDLFVARIATIPGMGTAADDLFRPVRRLLRIVGLVRRHGQDKLKLSTQEMKWALGAYFVTAIKFEGAGEIWSPALSSVSAAWHLRDVAPFSSRGNDELLKELGHTAFRSAKKDALLVKSLDTLILRAQTGRLAADPLTVAMAEATPKDQRVRWPSSDRRLRWDLASTGSVTNLTPLFGYVWLMARARLDKSIVVPKISSRGSSGGTVDILEAGGFEFPSEPHAIVRACARGGCLCKQGERQTPADAALMDRRRVTNAMKHAALTYASILSKKLAMGTSYVAVDVKFGFDTKMLLNGLADDSAATILAEEDSSLVGGDKQIEVLASLLKGIGSRSRYSTKTSGEWKWVEQEPGSQLKKAGLSNVRWFATNANQPQCRAVGSELLLLHLDGLITGRYQYKDFKIDEPLLSTGEYQRLYKGLVPAICDVTDLEQTWEEVRDVWADLKAGLPRFSSLRCLMNCGQWMKAPGEGENEPIRLGDGLSVLTFKRPEGLGSAHLVVSRISAYYLDAFYSNQLRGGKSDPAVGIWLHCLPGETATSQSPLLSVFFSDDRTMAEAVRHWGTAFVRNHVHWTMPE